MLFMVKGRITLGREVLDWLERALSFSIAFSKSVLPSNLVLTSHVQRNE